MKIQLNMDLSFPLNYVNGAQYVIAEDTVKRNGIWDNIYIWYSSRRLAKKIKGFNKILICEIEKELADKTNIQLKEYHEKYKTALDNIYLSPTPAVLDIPSWTIKPLVEPMTNFIELVKLIEMKLRISAYPERNEIQLTYDELRELRELTKDFEGAEEQNHYTIK